MLFNLGHVLCEGWRLTRSCQSAVLFFTVILYFVATNADAQNRQTPTGRHDSLSPHSVFTEQRETLANGWDVLPPYSFIQVDNGLRRWVGLDVELLHEFARRAGYIVTSKEVKWSDQIDGISTGIYDIATQATITPERSEFAYFSEPYRQDVVALIVPKGRSGSLRAENIPELIQLLKNTGFRLGIESGVAYPSKDLRDLIKNPLYQFMIFQIGAPKELVTSLLDGEIDGYFVDRILGAYLAEGLGVAHHLEEHPLKVRGELHLMFSKETVSLEVVEQFNKAIKSVHEDGTFNRFNAQYAFPILVRLTLDHDWFKIVDIVGTIAFAISGLLLAFRYNYDVFGAFVLASLPAVGGGVVRDLITNRGELAVLASPIYIEIIVILVVGGYFTLRSAVMLQKSALRVLSEGQVNWLQSKIAYMVQVCDAIGLAAFTVTGVVVAIATHSNPLWIWGPALAAITASGGGILRDVVRSDPEVPALKGELYPEIAVFWGLILSFYFIWEEGHLNADHISIGILVTFFGAFITRMMTIYLGLKSPRFST